MRFIPTRSRRMLEDAVGVPPIRAPGLFGLASPDFWPHRVIGLLAGAGPEAAREAPAR